MAGEMGPRKGIVICKKNFVVGGIDPTEMEIWMIY